MSNAVKGSFPANIVLPQCLGFLNRIQDPLALQKVVDRWLGFMTWDFTTKLSYLKLFLMVYIYTYYVICSICIMFLINPEDVHPELYIRMWFFIGAGASCLSRWIAVIPSRHHFAGIIKHLTDLTRQKPYQPLRVRSRPVIFLCSAYFFSINTSVSAFWTVLLMGSCPTDYVFRHPIVDFLSLILYPVETFLNGMVANATTLTILTTLLVFIVEFDILGWDFREAFNSSNQDEIRLCVERHQRLLEMVTLFREKTKSYFMIAMSLYFFLVTFSCLLLVVQLRQGDFQALRFNVINASMSIVSILLYGKICDMLEDRVRDVGDQVYGSDWPSKFDSTRGRRKAFLRQKSSILMITVRAQRKVGFTCAGIIEMSTVTSMQALKMFYTAFTILWNATSESDGTQ
ncbi:hypothetical protein RP20_CCG000088 [Aedes albopictus]|nr:hypothetical protein RP20_CCG000086 [Aedes albopictus]KXJ69110.1 hypothetical protein RP20_CCG000088 [Aedes albopictus]